MPDRPIDAALLFYLEEIRARLDDALGIAKAAEACGHAGNIGKAVEISHDIEQLLYESETLLNALSLTHRLTRRSSR